MLTCFAESESQYSGLVRDDGLAIQTKAIAGLDLRRMDLHARVWTGIQKSTSEAVHGYRYRFGAKERMQSESTLQA